MQIKRQPGNVFMGMCGRFIKFEWRKEATYDKMKKDIALCFIGPEQMARLG